MRRWIGRGLARLELARAGLGAGLIGLALAHAPAAGAAPAPFDLQGPRLVVTVTRAGQTLPIAQTPNLAEGDVLSIKAEMPPSQSVHYLLVAAFLRGVTNPPPESWFFQSRTWRPEDRAGLKVTAPQGAQQVLVFLAPETGGDFKTLVSAVRGRPGAFVRASQDLNQASLDHARLQAFLSGVQHIDQTDANRLKTASPLLARSLAIKLDSACLDKTADTQASCLTQGRDSLVLDDGHSTSMVEALSSGYSAALIEQLSSAPQAGGGYFSPYVASVLDIARLMDSFHTAQYQYIPALAAADGAQLSLLLNAPPSFQNPKSVLVAALPAVEPAQPPPLHVIDADVPACLEKPGPVLQAEGAPLVYSTAYAHDLVLDLKARDGHAIKLPVKADALTGGLDVDASGVDAAALGGVQDARLEGFWGFDPYVGPTFRVQGAQPQTWRLTFDDQQGLTAGRDNTVRLEAQTAGCVKTVELQVGSGPPLTAAWKPAGADGVTVTAPLEDVPAGPATLLVRSYGLAAPDAAPVTIYATASHLESFAFHAGDAFGVLHGADLDSVASVDMGGVSFKPDPSRDVDGGLTLAASDAAAPPKFRVGQRMRASARLSDGRTVNLSTVVGPPRPVVSLIGQSVQPAAATQTVRLELKGADELPHNAQMTFSIHAEGATAFTGAETLEVQASQGDFTARLTSANGGFILQNAQVALAMLDLGKAFGPSAFGPLRFRLVNGAGASDWAPLGVLVRLPDVHDVQCAPGERSCQLTGSNLFLIDSVSSEPGFAGAVRVPSGFPGNALQVPAPNRRQLFVRLSDDPDVVNVLTVSPRRERIAESGGERSKPAPP
ncbi:MAG TPA: hypothetical protein VMU59_08680 [Caulobacteraceae bacterium]|nr:hypothetical protein [Caulobacteraceae bacterium]